MSTGRVRRRGRSELIGHLFLAWLACNLNRHPCPHLRIAKSHPNCARQARRTGRAAPGAFQRSCVAFVRCVRALRSVVAAVGGEVVMLSGREGGDNCRTGAS